jgi:hypothetical protein
MLLQAQLSAVSFTCRTRFEKMADVEAAAGQRCMALSVGTRILFLVVAMKPIYRNSHLRRRIQVLAS